MSMISEQVKELRECLEDCDNPIYDIKMKRIAKLIGRAANTIESLSAKLKAANMEQSSEDCGGWIPCKERLPKVQDDDVLLCVKDEDGEYQMEVGYYRGREGNNGELMFNNCIYDWIQGEVIAWQPLPEPYHEP